MISDSDLKRLSDKFGFDVPAIKTIIDVESGGEGFSKITGKIIIQFEPSWFKREYSDWKLHANDSTWIHNGVGNQDEEWKAFNDAYSEDPDAAMKSTSIGIMQVMGFHFSDLGFKTVGEMWDFAKISEANQVELALRFICTNSKLKAAFKIHDWDTVAYYYNGANYHQFNYNNRLRNSFKKFLS